MSKCKYHDTHFDACARYSTFGGANRHIVPCHKCELFEPITNYDRLKSMSAERMAEMLSKFCETIDTNIWVAWLNSEVDNAEQDN